MPPEGTQEPAASTSITFDQLESRPGFFTTKAATSGRPAKVTFLPEPERRARWCTLISVDDHLVEPPHLFEGRMPKNGRTRRPGSSSTTTAWSTGRYDGKRHYKVGLNAVVGRPQDELQLRADPLRRDAPRRVGHRRPGRRHGPQRRLRLAELPVVARRASPGQRYQLGVSDPDLALAVVRAANDWHLEEWAGTAPGPDHPVPAAVAARSRRSPRTRCAATPSAASAP